MTKKRLILVDGSSLLYRAFFGLPQSLSTTSGIPTNATFGFAQMFHKILSGKTPSYGAVVFDAPGPTFRHERFAEYKSQRPPMAQELRTQVPWVDRVVSAQGFPILRVDGYEADDVIATLTRVALEQSVEVHIVSGDKDFVPLLQADVRMVDTMRDVTYDPELAKKKWGVSPDQFCDFLALVGDKVDNVPGVPGIGQKGAAKLLSNYGTLESVFEHINDLSARQKGALTEHREQAQLSRNLVTLDDHVPLDFDLSALELASPSDTAPLTELYRELEFFSLLPESETLATETEYEFAVNDSEFCRTLLAESDVLGFFPIFESAVKPTKSSTDSTGLLGVAVAGSSRSVYIEEDAAAWAVVQSWLQRSEAKKIVHNLRDTWTEFQRAGVELRGVVADAQLASFLIDPTKNIPHRLDQIAREFLQKPLRARKTVTADGTQDDPFTADTDAVGRFASERAWVLQQLHSILDERLIESGQRAVMDNISMPLASVLGRMQLAGIAVDRQDLREMGAEFESRQRTIAHQIYEIAGHEFNLASTKQLATVLFEELGLPVIKKTKTGYSTAAEVLERLAAKHEIARLIIRWRALTKLLTTYTRVLEDSIRPETGRIHCRFQQTAGASGRLITTDPDLQRTPIRSEDGKRIRQAFVASPGHELVSADWSQIELRVLAHFSEDELLLDSFARDLDVHRRTAAEIFGVSAGAVSAEQRNVGKTVNFATIYGQGPTALGQSLGLPRGEAKKLIDRYFSAYFGVRAWLDQTVEEAHLRGYVTTLAGRRRYIPELSNKNTTDRAYGERIAANTPIQGSAADLCKMAMLDIDQKLREQKLGARMVLQVHDELVFEVPTAEVASIVELARESMETAGNLRVPLKVDIGAGPTWLAAH